MGGIGVVRGKRLVPVIAVPALLGVGGLAQGSVGERAESLRLGDCVRENGAGRIAHDAFCACGAVEIEIAGRDELFGELRDVVESRPFAVGIDVGFIAHRIVLAADFAKPDLRWRPIDIRKFPRVFRFAGSGVGDGDANPVFDGGDGERPSAVVGADDGSNAAGCRIGHRRILAGKDVQGVDANRRGSIGFEPCKAADLPFARDTERNAKLERAEFGTFQRIAVTVLATAAIATAIVGKRLCLGKTAARRAIVRCRAAPHLGASNGNRSRCRFTGKYDIGGERRILVHRQGEAKRERRSAVADEAAGFIAVEGLPKTCGIERIVVCCGIDAGRSVEVEAGPIAMVTASV